MNIPSSSLSLGQTYTLSMESLEQCYLRKLSKYTESITVTLKLKSNVAPNPDGWLNEDVEIDFNNNETFGCKNKDEWIVASKDPSVTSNDELSLRCWKKVDPLIVGKS